MTQLVISKGMRLPRPVGVDWLRQMSRAKLLNLRKGSFIWYIKEDQIICAEVTNKTKPEHAGNDTSRNGVNVYYTSGTMTCNPHLIKDGQASGLYLINDREAAFEYYQKLSGSGKPPEGLKLVVNQ